MSAARVTANDVSGTSVDVSDAAQLEGGLSDRTCAIGGQANHNGAMRTLYVNVEDSYSSDDDSDSDNDYDSDSDDDRRRLDLDSDSDSDFSDWSDDECATPTYGLTRRKGKLELDQGEKSFQLVRVSENANLVRNGFTGDLRCNKQELKDLGSDCPDKVYFVCCKIDGLGAMPVYTFNGDTDPSTGLGEGFSPARSGSGRRVLANEPADAPFFRFDKNGIAPGLESGLSTAAIVGIVLSVLAAIVLMVVGFVICLRRKKRATPPRSEIEEEKNVKQEHGPALEV